MDNSTKLLYISNKTHISNEVLSNEPIDMPEDSYYYVSVSLQAFQSQRHVFTSNVTSLLSKLRICVCIETPCLLRYI